MSVNSPAGAHSKDLGIEYNIPGRGRQQKHKHVLTKCQVLVHAHPLLCSAPVGGGRGALGRAASAAGGIHCTKSRAPFLPLLGDGSHPPCSAGDRSIGGGWLLSLALTLPLTREKTKASPSFMPASLSKRNKTAHLFLSPTDFLGNGLLVPLM